jgi:multiple sugar transport system substrate-binding protein
MKCCFYARPFFYLSRKLIFTEVQMSRKVLFVLFLAAAIALMPTLSNAQAQSRTVVTWFVGIGTGAQAAQIEAQNRVVEAFNASQNEIELKINIAASFEAAYDALATLIAAGDAPDIVGPVGFLGANSFADAWLDIAPLVEKYNYNLKQFPESLVELYRTEDGGLVGIPFAVFPSLIFYNKDLFDEAELPYPPSDFNQPYTLNGEEREWNWDTLADLAVALTVDANGLTPNDPGFDPNQIRQFGFIQQWALLRAELTTFGGHPVYDAEKGKVELPDYWREQLAWTHDGLWKRHFIPNATYEGSELLQPSAFASGNVAMARVPLWYTCCIGDLKSNWDLAVLPSYNGKYHVPTDADTFRITKASKNPDAAFKVLTYLLGEAAPELLLVYGGYPARPDLQQAATELRQKSFPSVTNWDAVPKSLEYAASPHHESFFPNFSKGIQRFADFRSQLYGDTGKDMDLAAEINKLEADLQAIVAEAIGR